MRGHRTILAAATALAIGVLLVMGWIGYLGGPVFTDIPAQGPKQPFAAVILSSDTGFRFGMAPDMAQRLAARGVAVVGVNTLTFMRRTRTPDEVAGLVADAATRAMALGRADKVVLIGQSFGADMLHVGLARRPANSRAKIAKIIVIVGENTVEFRASPSEIFDYWTPTYDARPTAAALTWAPVLCVRGVEEPASLCPLMTQSNVRQAALPGGHTLHHDADALYALVSRFVFG